MKWNSVNVRKNIALFRAHMVLRNMDFTRGLFIVFLMENGINSFQVGILQSLLFWMSFMLEIPSGLFADKFKRKYGLMVGTGLMLSAILLYFAPSNFLIYLLIFALAGMGESFSTGAENALLYDGLREVGPRWTNKYIKIMSQNKAEVAFAIALATLVGGFLFDVNHYFIFGLTSLALGLALVCLFFIDESPRQACRRAESRNLLGELGDFFKIDRGRHLLVFIAGVGLLEGFQMPFFIFCQGLFREYGIQGKGIGFIFAAGFMVASLGMHFAPRLSGWGLKNLVFSTIAVVTLATGMVATVPGLGLMVLLFLIINTLPSILFIHTDRYIQDHCHGQIRATVCSVQSFVNSMVMSLSYVFIGFYADRIGIHQALSYLAVVPVLALVLLLAFFRLKRSLQ